MRDELLNYYERELMFLRQTGAEFAAKYPKISSRLRLEADRCEDPHVERLLEAFALLAARVHLKVDDEFPEITESLLSILYPHYIRPIPSMSVVQFHLDPEQGKLTTGLEVHRDSVLYSRPVEGMGLPCKFRTCYETTLWPLAVSHAQWCSPDRLQPPLKTTEMAAALRIELSCFPDVSFEALEVRSLRFYLNGEGRLVHSLYELLCNNCAQILVRTPNSKKPPRALPRTALRPAGFSEDEGMLPYPRRSFIGYRLLQEYFTFPEKFFFVELGELEQLRAAGCKDKAEIILLFSPFEQNERQQMLELGVSAKTLRLDCCPIVNLFPHTAEPISLDHTRSEYPVVPEVRWPYAAEIFSIDKVSSTNPHLDDVTLFEPFYSFRHSVRGEKGQTFWHATRRASNRENDEGTDVYLSLVDLESRTARPDVETVTVKCTCTNRDLPSRLPFGNEAGDFELEGISSIKRIVALRRPTPSVRLRPGRSALWRLISHLSLNYLSLVEEGREALQEILKLYNFADVADLEKQISGITSLKSRRQFARVVSEQGISFARGTRVEIEFDEEQFVGGGVYLFASVLDHFLGLYASLNSFSQLAVTTRQRKEVLHEWPPRAGQAILM